MSHGRLPEREDHIEIADSVSQGSARHMGPYRQAGQRLLVQPTIA
jgi:hypothetical protein